MKSTSTAARAEISRASHYFIAFFMLALVPAALGPTLSALATQTNASLKEIGWLFSMRSLGYLGFARFIGAVFDQRPGHPVMAAALGVTAVIALCIPMLDTFWMVALAVLGIGVSGAFVDLGGNILLVRGFKRNAGPLLNGLHFSFGLGAFSAPLLVALSLLLFDTTVNAFWLIGLMTLPIAVWLLKIPSPPVEATIARSGNSEAKPAFILAIVVFFFLYGGAEVSFGGWIHTYAMARNGMSETTAAYLNSGFWGLFTLGRLAAIPLTLRFSPPVLLTTQFLTCTAGLTVLLLSPPSAAVTWVCTIVIGLSLSSVFPLMMAHLGSFTAGSGRLTSWFFVGASSGSLCIPPLIGFFFERQGPHAFVAIELVCIGLGVLILLRIIR